MAESLTSSEIKIVELLADAFLAFEALPDYHPSDIAEFTTAIHAAQHIVMQRLAVRAHPNLFINIIKRPEN